ncbi:MAG TPA: GIY-YIG nuclease family protein [Bacteroidia bacterium]|nr:GIY-YIG nuclease family protein [Bacteroidia bacterium]
MTETWYTYILECSDGALYVGTTNNIAERVLKHNTGKGAKYTRGRGPVTLLYSHSFESRSEACKREYELKKHSRTEKLDIIKSKDNELPKKKKPRLKAGL